MRFCIGCSSYACDHLRPPPQLTATEIRVIRAVCSDPVSYERIAEQLGLGSNTVAVLMSGIARKLALPEGHNRRMALCSWLQNHPEFLSPPTA